MKTAQKAPRGFVSFEDCSRIHDDKFVINQRELARVADEIRVRHDWHEPDESGVSINLVNPKNVCRTRRPVGANGLPIFGYQLVGTKVSQFDNAFGDKSEAHIEICKDGRVVAKVNLANLLAWASNRTNPTT